MWLLQILPVPRLLQVRLGVRLERHEQEGQEFCSKNKPHWLRSAHRIPEQRRQGKICPPFPQGHSSRGEPRIEVRPPRERSHPVQAGGGQRATSVLWVLLL